RHQRPARRGRGRLDAFRPAGQGVRRMAARPLRRYTRRTGVRKFMEQPMNVWDTPERRALADTTAAFVRAEVAPHLAEWEEGGQVPRWLHRKAADAGLLGVGFSEDVGGQGGDVIDVAVMTEAAIRAGASTGLMAALFTHGIAVPHSAAGGNADQIELYVRPTLDGELIGSLGITEPGG